MTMIKMLFATILLASETFAATTTVTGTYYRTNGALANGTVTITNLRSFTTSDGKLVPAQKRIVQIKNGIMSVNLQPNTGSSPASYYTITTNIDNGPAENTLWLVPVSASPVSVASVTTSSPPASSILILPNQINPTGADNGDALIFNSGTGQYEPAPVVGGVSSVNGQTGTVTIGAASLAPGTVSQAEYARLDGVTSPIQTQLDTKLEKGTVVIYADDYCTVAGTYNQTCLSGAWSAAPSSDFKIVLGNRNYAWGAPITLSSKSRFTIEMLSGGKITYGMNIGGTGITISSCNNVIIKNLFIDGNITNQNAQADGLLAADTHRLRLDNNKIINVRGISFKYTVSIADPETIPTSSDDEQIGAFFPSTSYLELKNNTFRLSQKENFLFLASGDGVGSVGIMSLGNTYDNAGGADGTNAPAFSFLDPGSGPLNIDGAFSVHSTGDNVWSWRRNLCSVVANNIYDSVRIRQIGIRGGNLEYASVSQISGGACTQTSSYIQNESQLIGRFTDNEEQNVAMCNGTTASQSSSVYYTDISPVCSGSAGFRSGTIAMASGSSSNAVVFFVSNDRNQLVSTESFQFVVNGRVDTTGSYTHSISWACVYGSHNESNAPTFSTPSTVTRTISTTTTFLMNIALLSLPHSDVSSCVSGMYIKLTKSAGPGNSIIHRTGTYAIRISQ